MNFRIKIINRDYSILLIGQLVSLLGNIINGVAMMWIVYEVLGSAGKTGLLFGLSVIPSIALTPFAGNLADMMNRKYLLFICDLLAGVNSLVLFFLAKNNMLNFTNVFIILSIGSVLFSMLSSVRSSMIQNLVKANDYLKANSVITLMRNLGSIMLPTVGAFLIAKYDASFCFLIDGLSFIIASIITLNIKSYIYKKIDNITFLDNFKAGIIYLKKNLHYINFIILFSLINFLIASDIMLSCSPESWTKSNYHLVT